jgi:hypothetical protein
MSPFPSPVEALQLAIQTSMMMAEANMVITMRLMGMGGMWRVTPAENSRMVNEKTAAAMASGQAMGQAIMAGKSPAKVALAAVQPVRSRTNANVTRLAKRWPGKPT